ncbi:DUF3592 domain-containing protein [Olleya sp. HaHaR_3_96]|uniref:DUF3592 domain-containing protein n=1 Tax=Olleya sp. HaHaR_3_96 TaxID=2745560 RepID=UPI001C4F6D18|nr:DUF3592 domain-containing protein [Olleya sp. HaHaR_3_96]QXP60030.1 DUF3592 domain-containing protein [Olleya sp. HaHaR_3_96]
MIIYILTISGALLLLLAVIQIFLSMQSVFWNETEGIIIDSQFLTKRQTDSSDSGGTYITYKTIVKYKYQPKGSHNTLIGKRIYRINSNGFTTNRSEQHYTYLKLTKNTKLKVYYSPTNHAKCCLIQKTNYNIYYTLVIGIVLLGIGLGIYIQHPENDGIHLLIDTIKIPK